MEIFISWSGNTSGACAKALKDWLPCVMQSLQTWCSSEDISKGARGGLEIAKKLGQVDFGIVCLTPSNLHNEWIHFESGALSKNLDQSALFTLLLCGLQPLDVKPPLGHFQHTRAGKDEFFKMTQAINSKAEKPLAHEVLAASFDAFWPKLEAQLASLPLDSSPVPSARSERDILEEILENVRVQGAKTVRAKEADPIKRRTSALLDYSAGLLKGREVSADISAIQIGSETIFELETDGSKHLLTLELLTLSFDEGRERMLSFIMANTLSSLDIPF